MKKIFGGILFLLGATVCGCSNNKQTEKNQTAADSVACDTTQVPDMHNAENALDYWGTYEGTLPAADCPGIKVSLTLNEDKTFDLTQDYIDREKFTSNGAYVIDKNILYTVTEDGDTTYYKVEENRLKMLDKKQQVITGALADQYILNKKM